MGLDLCPFGRPKPGHEAEWNKLMRPLYAGKHESDRNAKRRSAISIQPYEDVGAPRVGYDVEADRWALANWRREEGMSDVDLLKDLHGYYVLALLRGKCDGLPKYTQAGLGYDVDETTFRGEFFRLCAEMSDEDLLNRAWTEFMNPQEAVEYGNALLALARKALPSRPKVRGPWSVPATQETEDDGSKLTFDEQIDVLQCAGRWYIFWGQRGHPIYAYA